MISSAPLIVVAMAVLLFEYGGPAGRLGSPAWRLARPGGIGQASAFCRHMLRKMTAAGVSDCAYLDDEYANPCKASHAAAVWFGLMLDEAHDDLDLAVRAYHRGTPGRYFPIAETSWRFKSDWPPE